MPSPGSPKGQEAAGTFTCFLCEADGFTATGMEQHITLFHRDDSGKTEPFTYSCVFCDYSTTCRKDFSCHLNKEHPEHSGPDVSKAECETDGEQNKSSDEMAENFGVVDVPDFLETSLRLNDCPAENNFSDEYDQSEDLNDDTGDNIDADDKVLLDGDMDTDAKPASVDGSAAVEESNLSVILASIQNGGYIPQPSPEKNPVAEKVSLTHRGGARPKEKTSMSAGSTVIDLTNSPPQASGSSVDNEKRCDADGVYSCPFCSFHTLLQEEIHCHVNQEHMMEEDASVGLDSSLQFLYSCPFCANCFDTPRDLSGHINHLHPDGEVGGGTSSQDWPQSWSPVSVPTVHEPAKRKQPEAEVNLQCPICGEVLKDGNEMLLALHVNKHFAATAAPQTSSDRDLQMALELQEEEQKRQEQENKKFKNIQTQYGMDQSMTAMQQFDRDLERAAMAGNISTQEFHEKKIVHAQSSRSGVDDGSTQVSGILEKLQLFYDSKGCPRTVRQAHFSNSTDHYSGSYGDKGWGCGYRNLQMMLSCLMNDPTYLKVLFNGKAKIPSIQKLQQLIEAAWQKGFDPQGCQQLGGTLVNTRKWIGATEVVALLSSFKIKCQVLDFGKPSGPYGTHPVMLQWVRDYFVSSSGFKPPLYLQHQGHSRTIVGVEELNNGNTNLLLFDPGAPKNRMQQFLDIINYNLLQTIRKTIDAFQAKQYQIVAVVGTLKDHEVERSKTIHSKRMS